MASKYIKPDNCDATIEGIKNKSTREVQRFLAGYEPLAAVPADRVRLIVVAKPPSTAVVLPRLPVAASIAESTAPAQTSVTTSDAAEAVPVVVPSVTETAMRHSTISADGKFSSTVEQSTPTKVQEAVAPPSMQFERRARVEFTAHEELLAKLDRVRSLMSHRLPINAPLEELFRFMADYVLQREDPEARQERREARAQSGDVKEPKVPSNPRQIPASVRDQIFVRDKRCTYVGPDGKRCESTHVLQVDHVKPVARRGAATIDNLRLLCAYHNRMESERLMGKRQVIRESRTGYAIMRSAAVG
jgi:5-methylcytosine-specific restriction endonuclease McrA